MHQSQVKVELNAILDESCDTVKVQESSSKILCFLVNDILDFAQLKSGMFRKNCQKFNLEDAINEVILVQKMKAEFLGVKLYSVFEGFYNYMICSDMQRIQQVLLNLQSNALKFTRNGGEI